MRTISLSLLLIPFVCAQVQIRPGEVQLAGPAAQPALRPGHVLATANGKPVTVSALREMMAGAPEVARQSATQRPKDFLEWTLLIEKLGNLAIQDGLDQKSPYKGRLDWSRKQILMVATMEKKRQEAALQPAEVEEYYKSHPAQFGTAKVKLIYLSSDAATDLRIQQKAASLVKQARAGADFGKLAKLHSEDPASAEKNGDFGEIGASSKFPDAIKTAIFSSKAGAVLDAVKQDGGYYIFQTVSFNLKPLDQVREQLLEQVERERVDKWMQELRDRLTVKIVEEKFFQDLQAKHGPTPERADPLADSKEVKPETVLAVLNGKDMTAEQYTELVKALAPAVRANAVRYPAQFFQQYLILEEASKVAAKEGWDKIQPYAGRLQYDRNQILMQAKVDDYLNQVSVSLEDQRKAYDDHLDRFRIARAKVCYIPYSLTPPPQTDPNMPKILTEAEALARASDIVRRVRSGAEFDNMIAIFSEDKETKANGGQMPPVRADDATVPESIRKILFAAKPGEILEPVKLANGYYVFRLDTIVQQTWEEIKDSVYEEIRQARFQAWFDGHRKSFDIQIPDEAAFSRALAQ
ncbi:MAG: peptidylprolyl isomerase [Acidobacteriia bacterium]|nr:peptidylprolyl isomerase [Terriglobia bacterium]